MTAVYLEPTGRRIAPFDDAPGDVLVHNRPLREWQERMFAEAGLQRVPSLQPPCLVVPDTLFTTGPVLKRLVQEAAGRDAVLVLADSVFAEQTHWVQPGVTRVEGGYRFDAVRFMSGRGESPVEVRIDPEEHTQEVDLGPFFGKNTLSLPRHPVLTLHHWVHILWANRAAAASETRRIPWWRGLLRVAWAILRARSLDKWKVLGRLNTIGRRCDIHPTAVVEGSTLGDGCTIGPHARVLFSTLGKGVTVMTGAEVFASTLGDEVAVAQKITVRLCVFYPRAFAGQAIMQACVLGRETFTAFAGYSIDTNFERDIRVLLDGTLQSTGTRFLGSAYGHGCRIGTGYFLAPGRALPNGSVVVRHPDGVVTEVPSAPVDGPMWNVGGRFLVLGKEAEPPSGG